MKLSLLRIDSDIAKEIRKSVHNQSAVSGLTHNFYRYPARFSNLFARSIIKAFTNPGDLIIDPYMGGGTTLVEARYLGRRAIGIDISSLATFIATVKTTPLSDSDISNLQLWAYSLEDILKINIPCERFSKWFDEGYQNNINSRETWRIRKLLELALSQVKELPNTRQQQFARCALLNVGQWALDCRKDIPTVQDFRNKFMNIFQDMINGIAELNYNVRHSNRLYKSNGLFRTLCLNRSAIGLENDQIISKLPAPKLILTSPPYPGVHVLYHRWQVQGRKETPAPFWLANCLDGNAASFYTFGDRRQHGLSDYFSNLQSAFKSIAKIADESTLIFQMVAFSEPSWQLPRYLKTLKQIGLKEIIFDNLSNYNDGRLWRQVPNRKWYADKKGKISSSNEVVLLHRLK